MAFRTVEEYNQNRYKNYLMLTDDGDYANVVFMYRSTRDVLVAEGAHYIKSEDYTGYIHCNGRGCYACGKGIRIQAKLFIPVYDVDKDEILFFDRNMRFDKQLQRDVFSRFPNPSEYVFRIERHGVANDVNTYYTIQVIGSNTIGSYDDICKKHHVTFPLYFDTICREVSNSEIQNMLDNGNPASGASNTGSDATIPPYQVTPRNVTTAAPANSLESASIADRVNVQGVVDPAVTIVPLDSEVPPAPTSLDDVGISDEDIDGDVNF